VSASVIGSLPDCICVVFAMQGAYRAAAVHTIFQVSTARCPRSSPPSHAAPTARVQGATIVVVMALVAPPKTSKLASAASP
jgi:hypothetical protein